MSEPMWFVLTVRPGMERAAAAAVKRVGAEAFLPGELRWVRAHRRRRGAKQKVQRAFVSLPGYLFVGMPGWLLDGPGWDALLALDLVSGVITHAKCNDPDGARLSWTREPMQLRGGWRTKDDWMQGRVDLANLIDELRAPIYDVAPGDQVLVTHDAFDRHPGKLVAITGDIARVLMRFFGAEREVKAPIETLVLAADAIRSG